MVAVNPAAGGIPTGASPAIVGGPKYLAGQRGATVTPLGSALYLPPIQCMTDRTLPPEMWNSQPGTA